MYSYYNRIFFWQYSTKFFFQCTNANVGNDIHTHHPHRSIIHLSLHLNISHIHRSLITIIINDSKDQHIVDLSIVNFHLCIIFLLYFNLGIIYNIQAAKEREEHFFFNRLLNLPHISMRSVQDYFICTHSFYAEYDIIHHRRTVTLNTQ